MIYLTFEERVQLDEHLIARQWVPGNHPNTWIQMKYNSDEKLDMPYFFLAIEKKSEEVFEVGGVGIGDSWEEEEIRIHLLDVLCSGTDYGSRMNLEHYLQHIGVANAAAHALGLLKAYYGDVEIPSPPEVQERTVFFDAAQGWVNFKWRGGHTIHVTVAVHCADADGYGTYSGHLTSSHGGPAVIQDQRHPALSFPHGLFSDRRDLDTLKQRLGIPDPNTHQPQPIPVATLPGLPEEVLLEVCGESGTGQSPDQPGSGERDA